MPRKRSTRQQQQQSSSTTNSEKAYKDVIENHIPEESFKQAHKILQGILSKEKSDEVMTNQSFPQFFLNYAKVLYHLEKYHESVEMAQKHIIVSKLNNGEAYAYIGQCYKLLADEYDETDGRQHMEKQIFYDKAEKAALASIQFDNHIGSENPLYMPRLLLGEICFEKDNFTLAKVWFEKAIDIIYKKMDLGQLIPNLKNIVADLHYNLGWATYNVALDDVSKQNPENSHELMLKSISHFQESYYYYNMLNDEASVDQCVDWLKKLAQLTNQSEALIVKARSDSSRFYKLHFKKASASQDEEGEESGTNSKKRKSDGNGSIESAMKKPRIQDEEGYDFFCLMVLDESIPVSSDKKLTCNSLFRKVSHVYNVEQLISRLKEIVYKLIFSNNGTQTELSIDQKNTTRVTDGLTMLSAINDEVIKEERLNSLTVILYHADFQEYCTFDENAFNYIIENQVTHLKVLIKQLQSK